MGVLDGQVCIVTGGAGSLGLASAELFLEEGGKVMLVDLDSKRLDAAAAGLKSFGGRVATAAADVADIAATKAYIDKTVKTFGPIDVMFSNAGSSGVNAPITDFPEEVFDRVMAVNVRASFLLCKYGIPKMNDGGSIVITSSVMGVTASPAVVAYTTSKHAVIGLMKTVSKEVAGRGIRVNAVAPGPIDNDFQTDIEKRISADIGIDATAMINQRIPLGRHAAAREVAETVLFLASARSSFSTGGVYMSDGGFTT